MTDAEFAYACQERRSGDCCSRSCKDLEREAKRARDEVKALKAELAAAKKGTKP